ncbi:MAG TPA: membrane-bound lytic murein transglycosylase MltF [Gammaproteobacteria bacterium]
MYGHRFRHPALVLSALFLLGGCTEPKSTLEKVQERGYVTVLTRNAATSYYEGPDGPTGIEYELAKGFADGIGVELKLIVAPNITDVLNQLADGKADFAAAGLTDTAPRRNWARFTPPYQSVTEQLVYRRSTPRPRTLGDLKGRLEVVSRSSHAESLAKNQQEFPQLLWSENREASSEDLLVMVSDGTLDYTVADSHELANNQLLYPELDAAFDLTAPEPLAWAFPKNGQDDTLYLAATAYFEQLKASGVLEQILERYYGHRNGFDYVGTRTFQEHIRDRLPLYQEVFQKVGLDNTLDWRLLAAMAYQESHWDADAVSRTGVRGIMMLTNITAQHLGVVNRHDPLESIEGGGRYLRMLINKMPERIQNPDRTWLALAAYNTGFHHLEDARIITQMRGGNPDSWKDVKANLPLLRQGKWHQRVRHGYARGNEAVKYVENIRSYYEVLVWLSLQEENRPGVKGALAISAPVL